MQESLLIQLLFLTLLLVTSGLISGAEVAFFSLTKDQLESEEEKKSRQIEVIQKMLDKPKRLLATILITNNFINIAIVLLFANLGEELFSQIENPLLVLLIEIGLITFLILFFGEILPKIYANRNALSFSKTMAFPIFTIDRYFLFFMTIPMSNITRFMESRLARKNNEFSIDKLSQALELTDEQETTKEEHKILQGIVNFGNTDTRQVMCPRIDVFALTEDMDLETIVPLILEKGFSRVPVYKENMDNVTGILYTKDLLPHLEDGNFEWHSLLKPPFYVPENKKLDDLLREFQQKKIHLAVVVDEYGDLQGIVTLEDILEEIVGDIDDEHDIDLAGLTAQADGSWIVDGAVTIRDLNRALGWQLPDEDAATIAGLVLFESRTIPRPGQEFRFHDIRFRILKREGNKITSLRLWSTSNG